MSRDNWLYLFDGTIEEQLSCWFSCVVFERSPTAPQLPTKMKVFYSVVLFALLSSTMAEETSVTEVAKGNGHFTNKWYKLLAEASPGENVFCSPISAHAVLSMAWQGAKETTADAFKQTLHVSSNKVVADGYQSIMTRLNNAPNITLLMANKIFLKDGHELLADFNNAVTKQFASDVQLLDFAKNVEAANTINKWVEDKTNNKIKDLIKADDLDPLTRLVLVNAIYFKGNWANQFNKQLTRKEPFYLNENDKVDVDMMHIKADFRYKQDDALGAQILEMPYQNRDYSMVIILPNAKNGITALEEKLSKVDLSNITQGMWSTEVNVALPKFKFETEIDLQESLEKLGLGIIFDQVNANFRGMIPLAPNENLYVSKAIQKAFIEVNEEGAEAAAATGLVFTFESAILEPLPTPSFTADHPFVFSIQTVSNHQRIPLFVGSVRQLQ